MAAIDGFMRRLTARMTVMQRFIGDAAHQIRTPLAALDAHLEIAEVQGHATARDRILRDRVGELARLAGQLLDRAMVIHRTEAAVSEPLDVVALVKGVVSRSIPLSLDREIDISFSGPDGTVDILGDPVALREAVANLVGNAIVHGARSCLKIEVGGDADGAWIRIADDGPGIPQEDWDRVLLPFQRGATAGSGSGLGLAIAAEVAAAHGGRLQFATGDGLFAVTLVLPFRQHGRQAGSGPGGIRTDP